MTEGKPETPPPKRVTAEIDELIATVLRRLRTGEGSPGEDSPLEELGLDKAGEELRNWRPDVPGAGTAPE